MNPDIVLEALKCYKCQKGINECETRSGIYACDKESCQSRFAYGMINSEYAQICFKCLDQSMPFEGLSFDYIGMDYYDELKMKNIELKLKIYKLERENQNLKLKLDYRPGGDGN